MCRCVRMNACINVHCFINLHIYIGVYLRYIPASVLLQHLTTAPRHHTCYDFNPARVRFCYTPGASGPSGGAHQYINVMFSIM